jgi:hypothetical protein
MTSTCPSRCAHESLSDACLRLSQRAGTGLPAGLLAAGEQGVAHADTQVLETGTRIFLLSRRSDRHARLGWQHVVEATAVHDHLAALDKHLPRVGQARNAFLSRA